jgi:serine/threonine protein kinase
MFVLDPKKRPSADECLKHPFFQAKIRDETNLPENQESEKEYLDLRTQSKSTEKTNGSLSTLS